MKNYYLFSRGGIALLGALLLAGCACNGNDTNSPSDNLTECERNSDCPGSQVCSPAGRCIDQCSADKDCPAGQRCREAVCITPDGGNVHGDAGATKDDGGPADVAIHVDAGQDEGGDAESPESEDGAYPDVTHPDTGAPGDAAHQDSGDAGTADGDGGAIPDASDAGSDAGPLCATGSKRCSPDELTVQICIGGEWKGFEACGANDASCQATDAGTTCVHEPALDAGHPDSGTADGGKADGGGSDGGSLDSGFDCSKIDFTQADLFCADLVVPICDYLKKCTPGDFADGGMTIESCREINLEHCTDWNRIVMCCEGVTFDREHAYECLNAALEMDSCYDPEPPSCEDPYIYPGYSEEKCGF